MLFPTYRTSGLFDEYRKVVLTSEAYSDESSTRLEDGMEGWFRQRVTVLGDGLAINVSDVTEIKVGEERYRSLSNFSNSVFENAPFSIIETDAKGLIRAINTATERLTGYKRADLVGKISITALHDPAELSRRTQQTETPDASGLSGFDLLTAKATHGEVDEREWTYIRNDGSTLPVHVAVSAVKDGNGSVSGFIAIASDITERKQLMTYLNHMASHDQLTGLPGRTLLRERIAEAIEKAMLHGRKVAVFVIDPRPLQADERFARPQGRRRDHRGDGGADASVAAAVGYAGTVGRRRVCGCHAAYCNPSRRGTMRETPG